MIKNYNNLIFENINDLVAILNNNFEFEDINEKVHKKILGYMKEDLIGKSYFNFIHPDDLTWASSILKNGSNQNEGKIELRFRIKNEDYIWLEVSRMIFTNENGEGKELFISRDISEKKYLLDFLNNNEENSFMILDSRLDIIAINDLGLSVLNKKREEVIGRNVTKIESYIELEERDEIYNKIIETGGSFYIDKIYHKKFDKYFCIYCFKVGGGIGIVATDLTEIINTQKKLVKSKEEYLKAYNNELLYKNTIIHDFDDILQNVLSSSEICLQYYENETENEIVKHLILIKNQINKGKRLISDILKLTDIEG